MTAPKQDLRRSLTPSLIWALLALVAVVAAFTPAVGAAAHRVPPDAYGAHSMVYSDAPYAFKKKMFKHAAAIGIRDIRADLALTQVITSQTGGRDWRPVDEYMALARRYKLRVTLVLLATPWWQAQCADQIQCAASYKCAARDPDQWGAWAGEIAGRTRGVIHDFEIINEPDNPSTFFGSPQQYAQMLVASYRAIKVANPKATVLLGGVYRPVAHGWIGAMLASPRAARSFDVANVHIRGTLASVRGQTADWKAFFASQGFAGPLWVTEHGYPSATRYQCDPAYRGAKRAQARYLRASLPAMFHAGAAKVFVTLRDNLGGWFASEGLLGGTLKDPPKADARDVHKRSFNAVRAMVKASCGAARELR